MIRREKTTTMWCSGDGKELFATTMLYFHYVTVDRFVMFVFFFCLICEYRDTPETTLVYRIKTPALLLLSGGLSHAGRRIYLDRSVLGRLLYDYYAVLSMFV